MGRQRSDAEQQVAALLRTAKSSLNLSVAFLSRLDGTTQHLEVVESSVPFLFKEGVTQKQDTTFCQAILDGRLPAVIPDVKDFPAAMRLPAARLPRIRSYVSVPVVLSDGSLYGTFCAAGLTSDAALSKRDRALMEVLAHAASLVIEPGVREQLRSDEIAGRLTPLMETGGPLVVLQPIVELSTGARVGAEALSRFPAEWGQGARRLLRRGAQHRARPPARAARAAARRRPPGVGRGLRVDERLTRDADDSRVRGAAGRGCRWTGCSSSSPSTTRSTTTTRCRRPSARCARAACGWPSTTWAPGSRRCATSSSPHRTSSSSTAPSSSASPATRCCGPSCARWSRSGTAATRSVVAEGVETADDAATLLSLGVDHGQGWHFGRPGPVSDLAPCPAAGRRDRSASG